MNAKNHFYSYLNTSVQILSEYDGFVPFAYFIKNYFSQHKKFGSKDRKQISRLCYSYFRLGKSFPDIDIEKRILLGLKLSHQNSPNVISTKVPQADEEKSHYYNKGISLRQLADRNDELEEEWQYIIEEVEKIPLLRRGASPEGEAGWLKTPKNIFPWKNELSKRIDTNVFEASFLIQPDLFLRIRTGFEKIVTQKLQAADIDFTVEENAIRLSNTTKIDSILQLNKEAVVQDLSSQKIGDLLYSVISPFSSLTSPLSLWDCCAASGGKSILAKDILKNIELTVSDIRPSIIANLKKRFSEAGIKNYNSFVADITNKNFTAPKNQYDLVIADVPCTGSGTWARTPEQLFYFDAKSIDEYAALQKSILENITVSVRPGGFLLYITCSVFKKENEQQTEKLLQQGFQLVQQKIIKGYDVKADTMFGALLQKQ